MRIYLDTCCLMRPFDDATIPRVALEARAVIAILDAVQFDEHALVASAVHRVENRTNPFEDRKQFADRVLELANEVVGDSKAIRSRAEAWMRVGVKELDALHLASGESAAVDVFATCDDNLMKQAKRLSSPMRIVSLIELHRELFP